MARRLLVGFVTATLLTVVAPCPSDAGTRGCVTHAEFRRVDAGMARKQVHQIFGTSGVRRYVRTRETGHIIEKRAYRSCMDHDHAGTTEVRFRDGRLYDGLHG